MWRNSSTSRRWIRSMAISAAAGAALAAPTVGWSALTTYTWSGAANDQQWTTAGNWSPNTVPNDSNSIAGFTNTLSGNQTIALNAPITLDSVVLGSNTSGGGAYMLGGSGDTGSLTLTLAGTGNDDLAIQQKAGSTGDTIAVPVTKNGLLKIANYSGNALTLSGKIDTNNNSIHYNRYRGNAAGTLVLSGTGSTAKNVEVGQGKVSVAGGSLALNYSGNNALYVYNGGSFSVDGGAVSVTGTLQVASGDNGAGTLTINSGSMIPTVDGSSHVFVTNSNGATNGTLNVGGGTFGTTSNRFGTISLSPQGSATAASQTAKMNVSGGSAYVNNVFLKPVNSDQSSSLVQTGGTLDVKDDLTLGAATGVAGTASVSVSDGTLNSGRVSIYQNQTMEVSGGTVTINNGVLSVYSGGTFKLSGGTLVALKGIGGGPSGFGGTFNFTGGTLALAHDKWINTDSGTGTLTNAGGKMAVAGQGATGANNISGSYTQSSGTLALDIGGAAKGNPTNGYDWLNITGNAALGGNLSVSLVNGFDPAGGTFTVLTNSSPLTTAFSNVAFGSRLNVEGGAGSFLVGLSGDQKSVILSDYAPIPEPAAMSVLGMGAMALLGHRHRAAVR